MQQRCSVMLLMARKDQDVVGAHAFATIVRQNRYPAVKLRWQMILVAGIVITQMESVINVGMVFHSIQIKNVPLIINVHTLDVYSGWI